MPWDIPCGLDMNDLGYIYIPCMCIGYPMVILVYGVDPQVGVSNG